MAKHLSNSQIAFIVVGSILFYDLNDIPTAIVVATGTGGWLVILLATLITIIFSYMIIKLGLTYEDNILGYSSILMGKFTKYLLAFLFIVTYFSILSIGIRFLSETLKLTILLKTPIWALSLLIHLVILFTIIMGFYVLVYLNQIYSFFIIISTILITLIIFSEGQLINIRPLFNHSKVLDYLRNIPEGLKLYFNLSPLSLLVLSKAKNKYSFKYVSILIALIGLIFILEAASCLSVLSVDTIAHFKKTAIIQTVKRLNLPNFSLISSLSAIFLVTVIITSFTTYIIVGHFLGASLKVYYKKLSRVKILIITFILSYIVSNLPLSTEELTKLTGYIVRIFTLPIYLIIIILFIIMKVKKHDKVY